MDSDADNSSQASYCAGSECSEGSRKNLKKDWAILNKRFDDFDSFTSFISNFMPYNTVRTTHNKTYCIDSKKVGMNKHKVTTEYRYCHPHKLYTNGSHTDSIPCEVRIRNS